MRNTGYYSNKKTTADIIKAHKHVCWYPSAGVDFRPLVFICKQYLNRHGALFDEPIGENELPDLFVFTDFNPANGLTHYGRDYDELGLYQDPYLNGGYSEFRWSPEKIREGYLLYSDRRIKTREPSTRITVKNVEWLQNLNLPLHEELIKFSVPDFYGKAAYMRVLVESKRPFADPRTVDKWEIDVIYAFTENTAFAFDYLIANNLKLDYIINVRYGCGFGGSVVEPDWLAYLIDPLNVKYFLTNRLVLSMGKSSAGSVEPFIGEVKNIYGDKMSGALPEMREIYSIDRPEDKADKGGKRWSRQGDVVWYKRV